jgi:Ran-binding protein 3
MTGEEDETTIFKCNAKVFLFDKEAKVWKERGRGQLKLNRTMPSVDEFGLTSDDDGEGEKKEPVKKRARLIMRTEGTYVVFLNAALFDGMKPGDEPTGNQLNLGVMENGVLVNIALKVWLWRLGGCQGCGGADFTHHTQVRNNTVAKELHQHISDVLKELWG